MESYEFEVAHINRAMEPPAQDESASMDDEDFTINLNPGKLRAEASSEVAQAPLLTKFIDDQQEARAVDDLTSGLLANLHAPLQQLDEHLLEL
jgi:hypothetical protein